MKVQCVIQGHKDREKGTLIDNYPTFRHRSVRMVLSGTDLMQFKIWTQDMAQSYIQRQDLNRNAHV